MGSISLGHGLRIGVDVGGTNTDAVLLDINAAHREDRGVISSHKSATTSPDVTDGIEAVVRSVLDQAGNPVSEVSFLMIRTTQFINAIVERDVRRLSKVAVIRLSKSFTREIPPFSDFPEKLKHVMHGHTGYLDGGLHIDGSEEAPIVESQVIEECKKIKALALQTIVISGVFSPIDKRFRQEQRVRDIMQRELPRANIVCSSDVSNIGFLERETAAILNASILKFARRTVRGFKSAMVRLKLDCALFLSQNDGSLIDAATAAQLPIRTFSSGPTNSMRGAPTIVVDIGGTTTNVGVLLPSGFPRQASAYVEVAGVNVNFPMPHIESIGLGGGSIVREINGRVTVGPDSVGHDLSTKAQVFGGQVCTATDIVVASGALKEQVGDASLTRDVKRDIVDRTGVVTKRMIENVIDRMKTSPEPLPVLLVGGGSIVSPLNIAGVSEVIRPPFHSVANAVGAAISQISGSVDTIWSTKNTPMDMIIEEARKLAIKSAFNAGALDRTIRITEVDAIPVQYVADQVRVTVKAIGEVCPQMLMQPQDDERADPEEFLEQPQAMTPKTNATISNVTGEVVDHARYRPNIIWNSEQRRGEWLVSEMDVYWMRDGCYVLGCAGGGSPISEYIKLRDQLRDGHTIRIIDSADLAADAVVYWGGNLGSPAVSVERLASNEVIQALQEMKEYMRHESFDAVMGLEIGGANGLEPLLAGSSKAFDRPVIDADFMGRAYPTYSQTTIAVYNSGQLTPCAIASGDGKNMLMTRTTNDEIVDRALRAACVEMGSRVGLAARPTSGDYVRRTAVLGTLSLAWRIGRAIATARLTNTLSTVTEQIVDVVGGPSTAKILFRGKIVAVERKLFKGHLYGQLVIEQTSDNEVEERSVRRAEAVGGKVKIPHKNENIYVEHISKEGTSSIIATVPDLIVVLDVQTGRALGVPEFRYGVVVTVLGITGSPRWSDTQRGLELGGPSAFGYTEMQYKPLGTYIPPRSVIEEYLPKR